MKSYCVCVWATRRAGVCKYVCVFVSHIHKTKLSALDKKEKNAWRFSHTVFCFGQPWTLQLQTLCNVAHWTAGCCCCFFYAQGRNCERNYDDCLLNPCPEAYSCVDGINTASCLPPATDAVPLATAVKNITLDSAASVPALALNMTSTAQKYTGVLPLSAGGDSIDFLLAFKSFPRLFSLPPPPAGANADSTSFRNYLEVWTWTRVGLEVSGRPDRAAAACSPSARETVIMQLSFEMMRSSLRVHPARAVQSTNNSNDLNCSGTTVMHNKTLIL